MKQIKAFFLIIVAAMLLSSCSSTMKIESDYDKEANFDNFKSYHLVRPGDMTTGYPQSFDPAKQQNLENAIIKEMETRGYTWAEDADLQVSYYVKVDNNTRYSSLSYGVGSSIGVGYWGYYGGYSYGMLEISAISSKEGSLLINIVDKKSNKLVWYGTGTEALKGDTDDPAFLQNIVHTIFNNYGFKAGMAEIAK